MRMDVQSAVEDEILGRLAQEPKKRESVPKTAPRLFTGA